MLIVVTLPPTLFPGTYRVSQITAQRAAELLRTAAAENALSCCVHFGSTAKVLRAISGLSKSWIEYEHRPIVPPPIPGDTFLSVRLATGVSPSHHDVGPNDLDYYEVIYDKA